MCVGNVREERVAVHDEGEWARLGEMELPCMQLHVFDEHVEQDNGLLWFVAEWPAGWGWDGEGTGSGGVWFGAAS